MAHKSKLMIVYRQDNQGSIFLGLLASRGHGGENMSCRVLVHRTPVFAAGAARLLVHSRPIMSFRKGRTPHGSASTDRSTLATTKMGIDVDWIIYMSCIRRRITANTIRPEPMHTHQSKQVATPQSRPRRISQPLEKTALSRLFLDFPGFPSTRRRPPPRALPRRSRLFCNLPRRRTSGPCIRLPLCRPRFLTHPRPAPLSLNLRHYP